MITLDFLGLFLLLAGYVIGLGAVTVVDIHGFLGRKSSYWTEATTRTHKVTKPLIWLGILLVIIGGLVFYREESFLGVKLFQSIVVSILIINGLFLTFVVSPFLLSREKEGKQAELLLDSIQKKIFVSFIVSFILWWGSLAMNVFYLITH